MPRPTPAARVRRSHQRFTVTVCGLTAVLATGSCRKRTEVPAPSVTNSTAGFTTAVAAAPESLRKIYGRWVRDDGGYVLEIRNGAAGGVLEASYFNPKSIRVSRAAWYEGGGHMQILIELNDVGYPGSTYVLRHDPATDRLVGQYTQPALKQTFQIEFSRAAKP